MPDLTDWLSLENCSVDFAWHREEACAELRRSMPCLAIVKLGDSNPDGMLLLRHIRNDPALSDLVVVAVTDGKSTLTDETISELAVRDVLRDTSGCMETRLRVRNLLNLHEVTQQNRRLRQQVDAISTAAQKEAEAVSHILLDTLPTGVVIVDSDTGMVEQVNRSAAAMLGGTLDVFVGRSAREWICTEPIETTSGGERLSESDHAECELRRLDGTRLPILKSISPIELGGHDKLLVTFVDLSDQQRRDGLYRAIFEHSFDAVMTIHARTRSFSSANPACLSLFGATSEYDFLLRTPSEYSPELQPDGRRSAEEYSRLLDVALRDGHSAFDWVHRKLDGTEFEASILFVRMRHGLATQIQVIVRDVSEQRRVARQLEQEQLVCERMEMEMRATQKLEAVGQLAAGIAHEINTPTQFASDSVHFLRDAIEAQQALIERSRDLKARCLRGEDPHVLAEEFDRVERDLDLEYLMEQGPVAAANAIEGLSRIAAIVRAMKEFSHPDASEKSPADLNAALKNTLMVARNEYKYIAEIEAEYGELPEVPCHLGALNQVFLNLIVNAAHAIGEKNRNSSQIGRIGIRTQVEEGSVRIDIADTGTGIPESLRERVFEPFFTTKEVGRGTGQGLAIARSIVCGRHGGTIEFETTVGQGTTFIVRIPLKGDASC